MRDVLKLYEVLDLHPGATAQQVRRAYVELAHVWHPDRFQGNPVLRARAVLKMEEIEEAYQGLRRILPEICDAEKVSDEPLERAIEPLRTSPTEDHSARFIMGAFVVEILFIVVGLALVLFLRGRSVGYH